MRIVPRRFRSILRYLSLAAPFYRWQIHRAPCPNCDGKLFLALRSDAFMTRCVSCLANVTNLSLIPVIKMHSEHCKIERVWEMSTYGATLEYLKRSFSDVQESEYFATVASGELVNGTLNQDVQNLSFTDASLDMITSSQVFEHVPDDIKGYQECYRTLRPGGALIFSIPLYDVPATRQLAANVDGQTVHYVSPEYHDSRHGGAQSVLCYWRHSFHDICARVARAGFTVRLVEIRIPPALTAATFVIYAVKPLSKPAA